MTNEHRKLLERNLKLFYPFMLSQRRLFYTLIGIYFLMMPGMSENVYMLGWFMTAGAAASFLFEIPSGYLSDIFGHKKTLVLSKILMIMSTLLYIFAEHWMFFLLAAVASSIAWSFQSGTLTALVHNTMESLDRESEFTKYFSKVRANISLVSAILLVTVPFFTEIDILVPFFIALVLDFIGLIAVWFITEPKITHKNEETSRQEILKNKSILELFIESKKLHFLPYVIYASFFMAFGYAVASYREVYLTDLGLSIALVGLMSGLSRIAWFFTGHYAHIIEDKVGFEKLQFYMLFYIPLSYIFAGILSNPYIIILLFSIHLGFTAGTDSINKRYFLNHYVQDKKYKATALSIKEQVSALLKIVFSFIAGYLFAISYSFGFIFAGVFAFIGGIIIWQFLKKTLQ